MSEFNAAQVLAEAYTLYKKHHDGMGLDFKIAIAQVREESEQRGAARGWDEGYAASDDEAYFFSTHGCTPNPYRADQMEADDD